MGSSESLVLMDGEQSNKTVNREEFVQDVEDPWWWEIENQDLVLNVVSDEIVNSNPSTSAVALARNRRSRALNVNSDNNVINDNKRQNPTLQDTAASPSKLDPPIVTIKNKEQLESEIESTLKKEQTLEEFKEELKAKRMARQTAVNDLREEIQSLRRQLAEERDTTRRLQENKSVVENEDPDTAAEYRKKLLEESDRVLAQQIADDDVVAGSSNPKVQLAEAQLALQLANADNLSLTTELGVTRKQVISLKEVVTCCKQMITVREEEVTQLKGKLQEIEESLVERELRLMSDNLRQEYDRQLANMRTLRQLYEERARVSAAERDNLQRQISMKKDELAAEKEKIKTVEESNANLEIELASTNEELIALKEQCSEYRFENKTLKEEMGAINKLFSQMLMGFNGTNNLDIDGLTMMLEENRTLLNDMATKEANSDCATLPKLLFELVQQVTATNKQEDEKEIQEGPDCDKITSNPLSPPVMLEESSSVAISTSKPIVCGEPTMGTDISLDENAEVATEKMNSKYNDEVSVLSLSANHQPNFDHYSSKVTATVASAEEIIGNLPKVWKVLMELLSHHKIERVQFKENGEGEDCFKSIETPNGPKAELSVSKTYIKLKDLILEKKSLVKETNRLKTLNCHLEFRLNEQQKRLSAVSLELQKTWHLVGKMQRQHRQLHTQEQILRYQLQQKRRLLYELKDELEYCRRKWAAAKAKTEESQLQCEDLRREFAKRKLQDNNNSAESGYSDGPVSDEDETTIGAKSTQMSKDWMPLFELRKPIKRTLSASPETERYYEDIALRRHSAPPSIYEPSENNLYLTADEQDLSSNGVESSRLYTQSNSDRVVAEEDCEDNSRSLQDDRASRIQKLEEQCKSLIAAVIQTSDNRERLEIQLCRFQDEISPPQYAVPLEEYLASTVKDGLQKLPSAIDSQKERSEEGCLTDREEEYTRKRSERLNRLEEESRQLMCRIKKTSDKGNSLRSSLERIHSRRAVSREGSFESNTEEVEESTQTLQEKPVREEELRILTEKEEEYSAKRAQRLQRLEEESKLLMSKLVKNSERGTTFNSKLDALRERYGSDEKDDSQGFRSVGNNLEDISKRLDVLEEETCQLVDKASHPSLHGSGTVNEHQTHQEKQNDSEPVSILPTPESVACSSIVSEEISERVIITRTPSQIAQSSGAVPKIIKSSQITTNSKTTSNDNKSQKLCASTGRKRIQNIKKDPASETLEEMVVRLRNLPFPTNSKGNEKCEDPTNHQKQ